MKFCAYFAIITLAIAATFVVNSVANNVTYGAIDRWSYVLDQRYVRIKHTILSVKEEIVSFPKKGQYNPYNITAVKVIDHKKKDGGVASLLSGGPGQSFANIRLKSERGHGLDYTVVFYGR